MFTVTGVRIMKILVCNAGSSSLKYQLIDMSTEKVLVKGLCERINIDGRISQKNINKCSRTSCSSFGRRF